MNSRKSLETDLQHYKIKQQDYELILKDQESISTKLLDIINNSSESVNTDEFQQRLNQNTKNIEVTNRALQEVKNDIDEIEFLLKSRKNHIEDFLQQINDNKIIHPNYEIKDNKQLEKIAYYKLPVLINNLIESEFAKKVIKQHNLFAISEMTIKLALSRNGIDEKKIDRKNTLCEVIENSNRSITLINCIEIDKPAAFITTEYYIYNTVTGPVINLVSDKFIPYNEDTNTIFSSEDLVIEKNITPRKNISEIISNEITLKIIINALNCMEGERKTVIEKIVNKIHEIIKTNTLLESTCHSDWLLLHNTLASFIIKTNEVITPDADRFKSIPIFLANTKDYAKNHFYQLAQSHLIDVFKAEKLTAGLEDMNQHYLESGLKDINFIEKCREIANKRGKGGVDRSQQTHELYQSIININFSISENLTINTACLKELDQKVYSYLNPPKSEAQLEAELKQYENEYNECKNSIYKLESPIRDARNFIRENFKNTEKISFSILNKNINNLRETFLDLEQHVDNGLMLINFNPYQIQINLLNHEITIHRKKDITFKFHNQKMLVGIFTFAIKDMKPAKEGEEIILSFPNLNITQHITDAGIHITFENLESKSISNHEAVLLIEDQPIKITFKNQENMENELHKFCNNFSNKTLSHKFRNNIATIDKIISIIRENIKFVNQDVLKDLVKRFPRDKIAALIDSHVFIIKQLDSLRKLSNSGDRIIPINDYLDFSHQPDSSALNSITISSLFSAIKPQIEKIKEYYADLFGWAEDNLENSLKIFALKAVVNIFINRIITKCDEFQFISLQYRIDSKIRTLNKIEEKINHTKNLLQALLNIKQDFYNSARTSMLDLFIHANTDSLTPELNKMKQCYSANLLPTEYITLCQKIIDEDTGWLNNWKRSNEANNLYSAITNIKFDEDKNKQEECLSKLVTAIQQYEATLPKVSRNTIFIISTNSENNPGIRRCEPQAKQSII